MWSLLPFVDSFRGRFRSRTMFARSTRRRRNIADIAIIDADPMAMPMRLLAGRLTTFTATVLFASGVLLTAAEPAFAHDELVSSAPADGATVTAVPALVRLYFQEPPADGFTRVTVTNPRGVSVGSGAPISNGSVVELRVRSGLIDGRYSIAFRILSDDGHPVQGALHFSIARTARASEGARVQRSPASASLGWIAIPAVVASSVGCAVGLGVARRRLRLR